MFEYLAHEPDPHEPDPHGLHPHGRRQHEGGSGAASSGINSALLNTWVEVLADQNGAEPSQQADTELIDRIRALEELKAAASAAQARAAAAFDASQRRKQALNGIPPDKQGWGVASQIALARRESAYRGGRLLGFAHALVQEMPSTLHALSKGKISEWRATLLVRETACLSAEDRQRVDREVAGDLEVLEALGDRQIISRARAAAYRLDPQAAVNRAAKAASERFVSCRPAPDTMTYLTGLLPVGQGVGVFAALSQEADRLTAAGDGRTRGQIMADTLVQRITGKADAAEMNVEVQLVMTDRALLAANSEPALVPGYGPVPAQWARDLVRRRKIQQAPGGRSNDSIGDFARARARGQADAGDPSDDHGGNTTEVNKSPDRNWDSDVGNSTNNSELTSDPVAGKRVQTWIRRLYTAPESGELAAMDSRARLFPPSLARFIAARDQTCRMPWCGAPIRNFDHIRRHSQGGPTSVMNGQGLCEACNHAKEAPGWSATVVKPPGAAGTAGATRATRATRATGHTVETSTPTGHTYRSTAPPMVGAPIEAGSSTDEGTMVERIIADVIWAA